MKKLFILFLTFISLNVLGADPKAAYEDFKQGKAVIIDVREKEEIKAGMIEGAQWFPLSKIETNKEWKDDFIKTTKGKDIYLYCRTGNRSGKVQNILKDHSIKSENIGGYESLKGILPVKK